MKNLDHVILAVQVDLVELLIALSIIMLMLSFITERLANFLKLYLDGSYIFPLALRQLTLAAEKKRELKILTINIMAGIFIATLANANFFQIIPAIFEGKSETILKGWDVKAILDSPYQYLAGGCFLLLTLIFSALLLLQSTAANMGWNTKSMRQILGLVLLIFSLILLIVGFCEFHQKEKPTCFIILQHIFGFIATGLFLSLGSKFWHDLLDVLFSFKTAKQHLNTADTFTKYSSSAQILALAETAEYDVAQKLFDKYREEIGDIPDVVSYGLSTVLAQNSQLYRKIIEVEFKTPSAQDQLRALQAEGSIVINGNTFYLQDYMQILHTKEIMLLPTSGGRPPEIIDESQICYAHNKNDCKNLGTFSVFESDGQYLAISNLHVFATPEEFGQYARGEIDAISNTEVQLVIEGADPPFAATILDGAYKIGEEDGYGYDYCIAETSRQAFEAYHNLIDSNQLLPKKTDEMSMFGARSKYVTFYPSRIPEYSWVHYPGINKRLLLFRIATDKISNIAEGDSGSLVYFKMEEQNGEILSAGILVSKSDNFAYMTRLPLKLKKLIL